jgi:hypothetical protein
MFIQDFSNLAAPLHKLTRKDRQIPSLLRGPLKKIVGQDRTLKKIDYSDKGGKIKLAVDSSYISAGAVLAQEVYGRDRPVLYKSVVFMPVESQYSHAKLKLCGVAKVPKQFQ